MEQLAHATLDYGPIKVKVNLFGEKGPDGVSETYHYGVIELPEGRTAAEVADWRADLLAIANGPYKLGITALYLPEEAPAQEV